MPDNTPGTTNTSTAGMLTAGITVTVNGSELNNCCSTPSMGKDPDKVDVTSFKCTTKKAYIAGLQDTDNLDFDFYPVSDLPADVNGATVVVTYPNGKTHSVTGDVRYYMLDAKPGDPLKARCSVVVSDWNETSVSSSGSGGSSGG